MLMARFSRQPQPYQTRRIKISSLPSHRDMEMWARGPSRPSAKTNLLAALYLLAFLYLEFRKMQIQSEQPLAVIKHNEIALEIKWPRQQHDSIIHCGNRGSARNAKIQTEMWTRGLAIEDAPGTKNV